MNSAASKATRRSIYFDYPEFRSEVPPESHGESPIHPVIIVGAGPVGLATALSLADQGVRCTLLEAETTIGIGSRAGSLSRHSVEFLATLGIGDQLLAKGLNYDSGWTYFRGEEVFRLTILGEHDDQFPPMLKIQQCYVELYLAERANAHPSIDMRWGHSVLSVEDGNERVRLGVRCASGEYAAQARYVVAADGGRSTVRRCLGAALVGKTFDAAFVIADVGLDVDLPSGRRMWFDSPWNPGGSVIMHLQPDQIWRFDYSVPSGSDPDTEASPEQVLRRIEQHLAWIGWSTEPTLDWTTLYKAHLRIVPNMRSGRVLFAGDAAHLIPIFGVRGLNGGLSDAANLAWKLARVVQGVSPDRLLDSYDEEQQMVFRGNAASADLSTRFVSPPTPGARAMRDAALRLARAHPAFRRLLDPRQSQPIPLYDSGLVVPTESQSQTPLRAGEAMANLRFADAAGSDSSVYLNELLGPGFTVLRVDDGANFATDVTDVMVAGECVRHVTISLPDRGSPGVGESLRGATILIRPDRYIAATWGRDAAQDLESALERAAGRQAVAR